MTKIQLRRGDAADWTDANPTLAEGEVGLELDTGKFKFGDGATAWEDLAYIGGSPPNGFLYFPFTNAVEVPDRTETFLTWDGDNIAGDSGLLDLTDPTVPIVVEAGVYAASVNIFPVSAFSPGSTYQLELVFADLAASGPVILVDCAPATVDKTGPLTAASLTWWLPAGGTIKVVIANMSDLSAQSFGMTAVVQRIS